MVDSDALGRWTICQAIGHRQPRLRGDCALGLDMWDLV